MTRTYNNARRAAAAAATTEQIVTAAEALLLDGPLTGLTLQAVAERAGVTVQTVLRHMGSRDGCFAAVRDRFIARVDAHRAHTPPGDVAAALAGLLAHYEADGRLVLNLLTQESTDPLAQQAAASGRAYHRAWVERCFGPLADTVTIDALVVATDLSTWKLLRLDLGRSAEDTAATITRLVTAILEPA